MSPRRPRRRPTKKQLDAALLRRYRWAYKPLLEIQRGVCAIDGTPPKNRRLDMDHDHHAMVVRGLLCVKCNRALLPWMTPEWLRAAADYLENPPMRQIEDDSLDDE